MIKDQFIYIAGPLCFYEEGYSLWNAYRKEAEFYGFNVTLPNDVKLVEDGELPPDKTEMSRRIFRNCVDSMAKSNGIIVNLETYRGSEPDGGSVYEMGMAYGLGARCYGFTRDKRRTGVKYQSALYSSDPNSVRDVKGNTLGHPELPFSVDVTSAAKIVEGSFSDCLKVYMTDLEEESKQKGSRTIQTLDKKQNYEEKKNSRLRVYFSSSDRDNPDAAEKYNEIRKIFDKYGLDIVFPTDKAEGVQDIVTDDPYAKAYNIFDRYQQHVRDCDIILLDLNDYRGGYEPNSDVSFEAGMAYVLGKKLFGFMDNLGPMIDRIPNGGESNDFRDFNGMKVENFDAPLNLMFGASAHLLSGSFEKMAETIAEVMLSK